MTTKDWIIVRLVGQTNPTLIPKSKIKLMTPRQDNALHTDIHLEDVHVVLRADITTSKLEEQL